MVGENLTKNSKIQCPHGGQAMLRTSNTKVSTQKFDWLLETDIHSVVGCPFMQGQKPSPCIRIDWSAGSSKTSIYGTPILIKESSGKCFSAEGANQGQSIITINQMEVKIK